MYTKMIRFMLAIVLGIGLFIQAPGASVSLVQAASSTQFQWIQYHTYAGNAANAQYGNALAESTDGNVFVVGARSETVDDKTAQGTAYIFRRVEGGWTYSTIHADDGAANDHFGASVAISGLGTTVLVGATHAAAGGHAHQGAAYVFVWSGTAWTQQAKLTATYGATDEYFGSSVALNYNGGTALIGAIGYTATQTAQGGAYVFTRSGTSWSQQTLTTPIIGLFAAAGDWMGGSVSLSNDGNTALIGASGKTSNRGTAYIYVRSGSYWTYQAELPAWDGAAGDHFAYSVSLSADGNTALIGAYNASSSNGSLSGAAYTFTRAGALWSNGVKLIAPDGAAGDWFGYAVSLSKDGSTAVIGALRTTITTINGDLSAGAAYVFYGPGFSRKQKLASGNVKNDDQIGAAVAVAGDGSTVVVGSPNLTWGTTHQGAAYVFYRYASPWWQHHSVSNPSGAALDNFGDSMALSNDGNTAIIGSVNMNTVFIYTHSHGLWSLQATIPSNDLYSGDFGASVALSGDGNTALAGAWQMGGSRGAAYLLTRTGSSWSAPTKIEAPDGAANDLFGSSVALSSDGTTAAIGADGTIARKGSVYVMTRSGAIWSALTRLEASDGTIGSYFGNAIALSSDGSTLLAGAVHTSNGTLNTGAAYVFVRSGETYTQQKKLAPDSGYDDSNFGDAVALSGDGNTALIGVPYWSGTGQISGLAYIYTRSSEVWSTPTVFSAIDNNVSIDQFGSGVALSADGNIAVIGAQRAMAYGSLFQGAVYVYTRSGSAWNLQAKVNGADGALADLEGEHVALSGDGHTLLFNADDKNGARGEVYFFEDYPRPPVFLPLVMR